MGNLKQRITKLFQLGEVDPVQDEKLIFKILLACERASIIVVAIVSGVAVAAYGYLLASGYTEWEVVRWATAIILFALATAITDVGVKYFIQKGAYDFFSFFNPATYQKKKVEFFALDHLGMKTIEENGKTYVFVPRYNIFQRAMQLAGWVFMVGLIAGMFLFDYYSVDAVRNPVANMVKKEKHVNQDSLRRAVDAQEQVRISAVVGAIQSAQADIRSTERQISAEKNRVYNSETALKKLIERDKNGWARGEMKAKQERAVAGLNTQLATLRQNKTELEQQRTRDLAYRSDIIAATDSSALATNTAIEGRNNDLVAGTSTMFIWLGFFAKCIAGLIRVMLVVLFLGNPVDANKDGKVDYRDVTSAAAGGFIAG